MVRSGRVDSLNDALCNLYDIQYLQRHPLAVELEFDVAITSRGQALHRRLLAAIDQLKPPPGTPAHALTWRYHRYVTLRYVHVLRQLDVAAEMGLTERHSRRVQKKALVALIDLLFAGCACSAEPEVEPDSPQDDALLESELARMGAGPEELADIDDVVRGVVETLQPLASAAGAILTTGPGYPQVVGVDRITARQILLNLLVHAIQNHPGHRIELTTGPEAEAIVVDIEIRPGSSTATRDEHVTIAERLAAIHAVVIQLGQFAAGDGWRVRFPTARPLTILVIDDNPDYRLLYRRFLTDRASRVLEAAGADEALPLVESEAPQLIILDVLMPRQDGWELLQILKNHHLTGDIPVIVCSVIRDRELALSLGASDFLAKPIGRETLLTAIERCRPANRDSVVRA